MRVLLRPFPPPHPTPPPVSVKSVPVLRKVGDCWLVAGGCEVKEGWLGGGGGSGLAAAVGIQESRQLRAGDSARAGAQGMAGGRGLAGGLAGE